MRHTHACSSMWRDSCVADGGPTADHVEAKRKAASAMLLSQRSKMMSFQGSDGSISAQCWPSSASLWPIPGQTQPNRPIVGQIWWMPGQAWPKSSEHRSFASQNMLMPDICWSMPFEFCQALPRLISTHAGPNPAKLPQHSQKLHSPRSATDTHTRAKEE